LTLPQLHFFADKERVRVQRQAAAQIEGLQLAIGGMLDKKTAAETTKYLKSLRE